MSARQQRVATAIRKMIAELMLYRMRDPRLSGATITEVEVTRDLGLARVYVSVLGEAEELQQAVEALTAATGFVRHAIGPELQLRTVPELVFRPDDSAARAQRVTELLESEAAEFEADEDAPALE